MPNKKTPASSPLLDFECSTPTMSDEGLSAFATAQTCCVVANAISSDTLAIELTTPSLPDGTRIHLRQADGNMHELGMIRQGSFFLPALATSVIGRSGLALFVDGVNLSFETKPVIETLSLRIDMVKTEDGEKKVAEMRGSTSARSGVVEAYSDGVWKGVGAVNSDGTFNNPNVPLSYLQTPDSILVRVKDQLISEPVLANDYFVHSRSIEFFPTATQADDQVFYHWRQQRAQYQPTGYWIPDGIRVTLWLEGDDSVVLAYVGTQGMAREEDRSQQTDNMRITQLKRGYNTLPLDQGGVLHISNTGRSACRIIIGPEAIPIPFYRLMQTPPPDWDRMRGHESKRPVQMVGKQVVISCYPDTYKLFAHDDVGEIVRSHEDVIAMETEAAGFKVNDPQAIHRESNTWLYAVESSSSAVPHATTGYIGLPHRTQPGNEYMLALVGGKARNLWVTLHEYGHHFQTKLNSVSPFSEVSVNIYALAVSRQHKNQYSDVFPGRWSSLHQWLRQSSDKEFITSPDTHAIFEQLRLHYGNNFLPNWDRRCRELAQSNPGYPSDLTHFATSLSQLAGQNLANFFVSWGVIKSGDSVWQTLQALNLPDAPASMIDIVPYQGSA
ncbi:M60 family metallopeptidase [Pseudomonas sp. MLB6B]